MATFAVTGNDTLIIDEGVINDLANGDAGVLTHPDDIGNIEIGKNGNAIFSKNEAGKRAELVLRVILGSPTDRRLQAKHVLQDQNFAGTIPMTGEFIKKVGDGVGGVKNITYLLSGGIFTKNIDVKTNTTGDVEQSIAIYTIGFASAKRAIGQ